MADLQWRCVLYELRQRIAAGKLRGGDKLRASHLAQELKASRTPISEALLKLEAEGLIERDKSGFSVRSFNLEEVYDAIDLRGLLEAAAAQKAAERGVPDERIARLRTLLEKMDELIERQAFNKYDGLNDKFHAAFVEASASPILQAEVRRAYRFPFAGPSAFPTIPSDWDKLHASIHVGQSQHHQIVDALERREGARVFYLVREHARLAHRTVLKALASHQEHPQLALVNSDKAA